MMRAGGHYSFKSSEIQPVEYFPHIPTPHYHYHFKTEDEAWNAAKADGTVLRRWADGELKAEDAMIAVRRHNKMDETEMFMSGVTEFVTWANSLGWRKQGRNGRR